MTPSWKQSLEKNKTISVYGLRSRDCLIHQLHMYHAPPPDFKVLRASNKPNAFEATSSVLGKNRGFLHTWCMRSCPISWVTLTFCVVYWWHRFLFVCFKLEISHLEGWEVLWNNFISQLNYLQCLSNMALAATTSELFYNFRRLCLTLKLDISKSPQIFPVPNPWSSLAANDNASDLWTSGVLCWLSV